MESGEKCEGGDEEQKKRGENASREGRGRTAIIIITAIIMIED